MGLRINTNIYSIGAQRNLRNITTRLEGNFGRLSSGLRINSASDDPAGLAFSERLRAQVASFRQLQRNGQDGVSLVQTAEAALGDTNTSLVRLRELALSSANGTLNAEDRANLDSEFQLLIEEIDRIGTETNFNEVQLLDSTNTIDIQIGVDSGDTITLTLQDATALGLGISLLAVDNVTNASAALATIDAAIDTVTTQRAEFGAQQSRLVRSVASLAVAEEQVAGAESRIRDVDVAAETADLTRNSILQQAAVAVLAQANVQPQLALSLLG